MACGTGSQTIGSLNFTVKGAYDQAIDQNDYDAIVKALDTLAQFKYFQHNFREEALLDGFNNNVDIIIDYNAPGAARINPVGPSSAFFAVITINPTKLKQLEVKGVDGQGHSVKYIEALGNEFGNILVMANDNLDFDGDGDSHNDWAGDPSTRTAPPADLASIQVENVVRALAGRTARALDENPFKTDANHDPSLSDEEIREILIRANVEHANRGSVGDIEGSAPGVGDTPCETEGWFSKWIRNLKQHHAPDKATPVIDSDTKSNIKGKVDEATDEASPLVLDLDGDGVELIAFDGQNQTFFDLNETGFAVRTGWVAADDGLLAIDWNANGRIDNNGELFGSATTDGFTELRALDSNDDGVIDAEDQHWEDLVIWQDANGDGVADFIWGEVQSLDAYDIVSLDLNATEVSQTSAGHRISHTSTYTYDTGSGTATRDMADVWFEHDKSSTRYAQDYTFDLRAAYLIGARGYGTLPDLHIAISLDNDDQDPDSLLSLVTDFSGLTAADIFAADTSAMDAVRAIMYRWANVEDVNPTSRGQNVDAQELGFLEAMTGEPFLQQGYRPNPFVNAGRDLTDAFELAHRHYFATLAAQTEAGELFAGDFYYDLISDSYEGITGLNTVFLDGLETTATALANTAARELFWSNVLRVIEYTVGVYDLDTADLVALGDAISGSDASLNVAGIMELVVGETELNEISGTSGAETLSGTTGDDYINALSDDDTVNGGAGNDDVRGGYGNDILAGNTGSDYLRGEDGADTYVYNAGDGVDIVDDRGGTSGDKILIGAGFDAGDLTFTRVGPHDLQVTLDNGTDLGQIVIADQFGPYGAIETIELDDTTTIDLTTMSHAQYGTAINDTLYGVQDGGAPDDEIHGGDGNDTIHAYNGENTLYGDAGHDRIYAGSGDDTIYGGDGDDYIDGDDGNNIFYAGAGDDTVESESGDDTYHYASGHDVYSEGWGGTDAIYLAPGYTSGATVYYKINNDLKIVFDEDDTITVSRFFQSSAYKIEALHFDGGPSVDLTTVSYTLQGDESANTLSGTSGVDTFYGEGGDDTITGGNGDDFLYGGTGNDSLSGGDGNDYLDGGAGDDYITEYQGNDTFYYVSGHDTFVEDWGGTDTILMAEGWTFEDVTFRRYADAPNNLILEMGGANSITVVGHFQNTSKPFEYLQFADSSSYDLKTMQYETHGGSGNDSITGITYSASLNDIIYGHDGHDSIDGRAGDDVIDGGDGNDHLEGFTGNDTLIGGAGDDLLEGYSYDDLYIYASGHDTIYEYSGTDTLRMAEGWTFEDITFRRYSAAPNNLVLELDSENSITITSYFQSTSKAVETLVFADESSYTLTSLPYETHGTSGSDSISGVTYNASANDTIFGYEGNDAIGGGSGNDILDGGDGNDELDGGTDNDTLIGGSGDDIVEGKAGNDTFIYTSGLDTYYEASSGTDKLVMSGGVTINEIATLQSGYDAKIIVNSGVDEVTIYRQNYGSASYQIETIHFDDGFVTTLNDHLSWDWGTSGADTLTGTSGHDTIIGKDGNDGLDGAGGADNIHGGSGNDTIRGGDSSDLLHGGLGDDILFGDDGADTIFGGGGADAFTFEAATAYSGIDIIKDFNAGESDVIDIADVLDGIYDPMSDVLADFVQISESAGDTLLSIDRDGTGTTYGWTQIASIQGVTGLEDADAMVTAGQLLAA